MCVVVPERETFEVFVDAQPKIIADPLRDTLGVVVVNVRRDAAENREDHHSDGGDDRERLRV